EVDDVVEADVLREPHGRYVAGEHECIAQGDRVGVAVVQVARSPDLSVDGAAEGTVAELVEGRVAVGEGGGVDDGLEGAGGLAFGDGGAVVSRVGEVAAADHGEDVAGRGIEHDDGTLEVGGAG